jgi:DNA repair exonuclease SbcCD nuclease subunit
LTTPLRYRRTACFTDIHWGCRGNSEVHNDDCQRFIDWFCELVKSDPEIDSIAFLGDWYESRSAINTSTLNYSHKAAKQLNELGLPVYFIIGNHDLYHKNTRKVYAPITFGEFSNFIVINEPTEVPELGDGSFLCPYLFHHEYPTIKEQYKHLPVWFGHFEFMGFVITGQNHKMLTGPNPLDFATQRRVFSGHFHKRQTMGNVTYIGNTFPTNYSDSGDNARGAAVYDHDTDTLTTHDWLECPKYQRVLLSDLIEKGPGELIHPGSRVRCYIDQAINYEETMALKDAILEEFFLREFVVEEVVNLNEIASDTNIEDGDALEDVDHLVVRLLGGLQTDKIKPETLIAIYGGLSATSVQTDATTDD